MPDINHPYTPDDLRQSLDGLGVDAGARLAVAISGGADSTALAWLAHQIGDTVCLTVDHGLRQASAAEAKAVAAKMAEWGVQHVILPWEGEKPTGNIQAEARAARYRLMADWCEGNGVKYLLTAHHEDDQAETLLLRLARGSGIYGLAAMPPIRMLEEGTGSVKLVRPLLEVPRIRLRACLDAAGIEWIEDPSNNDSSFDRVRVRNFLSSPPLEGFSASRLAATARRMRRTRDALEFYENQWLAEATEATAEGNIILSLSALMDTPEEIILRGIASVCRYISGQDYVPRMEKLERAAVAMQQPGFTGLTLYGCRFLPGRDGRLLVCRELASMEARKQVAEGVLFDNRFSVSWGHKPPTKQSDYCVGALGQDGWNQAVGIWPEIRECGLPFDARLTLPALFEGKKLRAIPHLGYDCEELTAIKLSRKGIGWPKK